MTTAEKGWSCLGPEDKELCDAFYGIEDPEKLDHLRTFGSSWVLRFEISRDALHTHGLTMETLQQVLPEQTMDLDWVISNDADATLIARVRWIYQTAKELAEECAPIQVSKHLIPDEVGVAQPLAPLTLWNPKRHPITTVIAEEAAGGAATAADTGLLPRYSPPTFPDPMDTDVDGLFGDDVATPLASPTRGGRDAAGVIAPPMTPCIDAGL
jgi:hypothetical protein